MEIANFNIPNTTSTQLSSSNAAKSDLKVSSGSCFKKTLEKTVKSTSSKSNDETKLSNQNVDSTQTDSSDKVEDEKSNSNDNQVTVKDTKEKPDDLIAEIVALMNSSGNINSMQNLKDMLLTNSNDVTNKIINSLKELLSQIKQYKNLPENKQSDVLQNLLQQISQEISTKFTLIKTDNSSSTNLKQIITNILTTEKTTESNGKDDSLVASIKTEIGNILKENADVKLPSVNTKGEINQATDDNAKQVSELNSVTINKDSENDKATSKLSSDKLSQKDDLLISTANKEQNNTVIVSENNSNNQVTDTTDKTNLLTTKEEKLLKELTDSKDKNVSADINASTNVKDADSKIQKVTMFSSMLNNIKNDNITAPETNIVVYKNNVVNDLIKSVKYMETNNIKDMTVKIMPKELGEVVIKITMEGNVMKANLTVNNKEAYNIINSNLSDMNNKLSNQEIKIQNFTINIFQDTTSFNSDTNGRNSGQQNNKNTHNNVNLNMEDDNLQEEGKIDSRVNILA